MARRAAVALLGLAGGLAPAAAATLPATVSLSQQAGHAKAQDRAITQVVKLLQDLAEKSKAEGDTERSLFGKYKCYCDTNEASKNAEIERLTNEVNLLETSIEEIQAATAKLSSEVAKLDKDMAENDASRQEAQGIRDKEHDEFLATEADLADAVDQMKDAIDVLSKVGADQFSGSAADHAKYMAGQPAHVEAGLVAARRTVKKAMVAAMAFASEKQAKALGSFVQAPFTGTYSAQSGEVVGILKDMRDTFSANLASARERENTAMVAHRKFMAEMTKAHVAMAASFQGKQAALGSNDGILAGKKQQLASSQEQLAEAEDFLSKLVEMCSDKKKQYDERVALRSSEQAALSEAIAILNSDAAFETFGKVAATSSGAVSFVQRASVHRHRQLRQEPSAGEARREAVAYLRKQRVGGASLGRVVALLQANNPFATVLEEITKMIALLDKEEQADVTQKAWCDEERLKTTGDIEAKQGMIGELTGEIDALVQAIEDPETGLKVSIKNTEESKEENFANQVSETKDRKADNVEYQANVGQLVEAQALLQRAVTVLSAYYKKIAQDLQAGLLQKGKRDDPAPPSTWEDTYKGQSEGGNNAITMVEFILGETRKEESMAHSQERDAQHAFEDSMTALKAEEQTLMENLASMRLELAQKAKLLLEQKADRERTEKEVASLEAYLVQIKPGCDFIDANIDQRKASRSEEKAALKGAVAFLKQTPVYRTAMDDAHQESLGKCKDTCMPDEAAVACKACLADVSIPGYCASHPTAQGC